jgi:hypothetical protein
LWAVNPSPGGNQQALTGISTPPSFENRERTGILSYDDAGKGGRPAHHVGARAAAELNVFGIGGVAAS